MREAWVYAFDRRAGGETVSLLAGLGYSFKSPSGHTAEALARDVDGSPVPTVIAVCAGPETLEPAEACCELLAARGLAAAPDPPTPEKRDRPRCPLPKRST